MLGILLAIRSCTLKCRHWGIGGHTGATYFSKFLVPFLSCNAYFDGALHPPC